MRTTEPQRRWFRHGLWAGPLLVFGGAVSYFLVFVNVPALRDVPWVNVPLVGVGLAWALAAAWPWMRCGPGVVRRLAGCGAMFFSLMVAGMFCWYVFLFSYTVPAATQKALTMESAPEFSLPDTEGRHVRLSDFRGRKVVLCFYRGHW